METSHAMLRFLLWAPLMGVGLPVSAIAAPQGIDAFVSTNENAVSGRHRRLYRVPLAAGEPAQLLFEGPDLPRVLGRASKDGIVIAGACGPEIFDLVEEESVPLFEEPARQRAALEWVGFLDGAAFAVRRSGDAPGALLRLEPDRPEVILHASGVRRVLEVGREGIWYLVEEPVSVWTALHRPGTAREVVRLPDALAAALEPGFSSMLGLELSPSGRHLAVAHPHIVVVAGADEPPPGGSVAVHDTVTGELIAQQTGISLGVSPFSSSMPTFELVWASDRVLRFSETVGGPIQGAFQWVDWDVVSGQRVAAHQYGWGLSHSRPDSAPPAHDPRGHFVHGGLELLRATGPKVVFDACSDARGGTIGKIRTGPRAEWAIAQRVGVPDVYRVGNDGEPEHVGRGWILDVTFW